MEYSWFYLLAKWLEPDADGNSMLHRIAMNGDVQMMSAVHILRLVNHPLKCSLTNTLRNKEGKTPLNLAKPELMKQLLQKGKKAA